MSDEHIFAQDELHLLTVSEDMDREAILATEGIFFFKDIAAILGLESTTLKEQVRALVAAGQSPWQVMGVRKIWHCWLVRMKLFAPYYRAHLQPHVASVQPGWDGNTLLEQDALFALNDVCHLFPITAEHLRYHARKNPSARSEIGVFKDEVAGYVVDTRIFGPWLRQEWLGNATCPRPVKPERAQ